MELGELLELEIKVRLLVWVELEALLIRVELEVLSRTVIGDLRPAPGHPIHSHTPRQEEYEQAILSSLKFLTDFCL